VTGHKFLHEIGKRSTEVPPLMKILGNLMNILTEFSKKTLSSHVSVVRGSNENSYFARILETLKLPKNKTTEAAQKSLLLSSPQDEVLI
jgi:hypothetical protein